MTFAQSNSDTVSVELPNEAIIKFEVTTKTGRKDASTGAETVKQFKPVADAIEGVVQMIAAPIQKVKPKKATVKFGMELAVESGNLTTVIVKGSGKANLEITLEWENEPKA